MLKSGFIYITVKYNRFTDAVPFGFRPLPQASAWAAGAHDQGFAGFAKVPVVRPSENFCFRQRSAANGTAVPCVIPNLV